ncbi:flocculation protein FLO11 isoform X1 [Oncorhynchus kisutch]|uniref:flocculation protein FLO11 isoform X1 n=2 Tax=Oncorhynchus kisutch TaxID=8019 RepID=UPI0012DFA8EA|nr:flocculation protein FLO11 isoform X1 [Oncorhynchus kisutch]
MASVKQEDCSQTLGLNVNIKDEVKEEEIETFVYHGPAGEFQENTEEHKVLLLKDKGKRKPKGMEKETEKKRHRFTPGDEDLIISGVLGHWEDLFGAQAHIRPRGSKTATWNTIAGTLTSAVARCGDDVRKKYNLIRSQIKQKVSSIRTLSTQTGGGPNTVPALTDLEQQLFSRMAETEAGVGPVHLGFGLSQGEISSSGPPPTAEGTVESALPSVTMEELPSTSPSTPWPAPTVPPQPITSRPAPAHSGSAPQPITSRPAPAHSIHSQSMNQIYFIKPFLHQQLSQSALQIPSLKSQIASNADALSGIAPQPITSCPAPAHSIHSGFAPQPITSCPAPAHSIHSGFAPQPITSCPAPAHSIHSGFAPQPITSCPAPAHSIHSGFAPQPITSCPAPAHSIHSGFAPQPITSCPAPAHSIHSGFAPQPITSCPAPAHSIHSDSTPQPITSGWTPQGPQANLLQQILDTQTQQIHVTQTAQHIHQALYDLLEKAHETQKAHLDVEKNRLQLDRERLRVETERLQVERERLKMDKDRLGEGKALRQLSGSVALEHQTPVSSRTVSASPTIPLGTPSASMSSPLTLISPTAPHFDFLFSPLPVITTQSTQPSQTSPAPTSPTLKIPAPTSPTLTSSAPTSPTLTVSAHSLIPPISGSVKRRVQETVRPWPAPTAKNTKHQ